MPSKIKTRYYLYMAMPVIIILGLIICYCNDSIFYRVAHYYVIESSDSTTEIKCNYDRLPDFMQLRLLDLEIQNLSNRDSLIRANALAFFLNLSGYYPAWRKYAVVGFENEQNSILLRKRLDLLVYGRLDKLIHKESALKYQQYFKDGLKSEDELARAVSVAGLASAYRNDEENFREYVIPYCDDSSEYVKKTVYLYLWYFKSVKDLENFLKNKQKSEKQATIKKFISNLLNKSPETVDSLLKKEEFF